MQGAQVAPKLIAELKAQQYRTDLVVAGTTTALEGLAPVNAIVPMQPFLVGPESRDLSKWKAGKLHFSDDAEKYNLVYGNRVQVAFVYNRDSLAPGKIKSWKDLLNPEWKGKIAMLDPRRAGGGLGHIHILVYQREARFRKKFCQAAFHDPRHLYVQ